MDKSNVGLKDYFDYYSQAGITFSPNGENAAFLVKKPNADNNSYDSNLWLANVKTGKHKKLTAQNDAKKFIFLNNDEILFEGGKARAGETFNNKEGSFFYKIPIDGGEGTLAFHISRKVKEIKQIDDNRFLVKSVFDNAAPENEKDEDKKTEKKNHTIFDELPNWSNENGLINKKRDRLYIFNSIDGELTPVSEPFHNIQSFAPAQGGVVFASKYYTDVMDSFMGVYFYDYEAKTIKTLLEDGLFSISSVWLHEEKVFFLGTDTKKHGVSQNKNIYLLEDGFPNLYCEIDSGVSRTPVSADDGIYFLSLNRTKQTLYKTNGTKPSTVCEIDGWIDDFDIAGNNILCIARENTKLPEVFSIGEGLLNNVTSFNAKVLDGKKITPFEKLEAINSGVTIEGYLLKPYDFDPEQKYPALLYIHGGPKVGFGPTFNHEFEYYASKGYFIFCCNPRGADGYGDDFANIRGKYGILDYEDVMAFTDRVIEKYPQIDTERMGVFGKSYGGYLTNWIIGHTNRFKCAVSRATISNLFTKILTTDIGYYHNMYQQGCTPWDDPAKLWWHSPLKYADKVQTPTLFIQGDEDYRTWMAEPLQMFTALKYHGVESRLCLIYGENHTMSIKPLNTLTMLEETSAWFEKYLGV